MKKDFYPDRTICSLQLELKNNYKLLNKNIEDRDVNGAVNILKVYKTKLGDYSTPFVTKVAERYFGDFHCTNSIYINL